MIKNLVISGGGIKIISAFGVIKYLEENNLLKSINNFYGTSAGSILCLILILGFNAEEIIKFIEDFDLNKIFIINSDNLFTTFNVCENTKLEKVIKLFLNFKLGRKCNAYPNLDEGRKCNAYPNLDEKKISLSSDTESFEINNNFENITMKELYNKTNKYFSITSVCLDTHEAVYISHETFPDIPVWKAILMSCSIPLIFKPIEWENKLYIDGGLVDNFPLFNIKLDEIKYTLGIQINLNYKRKNDSILIEESNIYNYVINLIQIIMESKTEIKPYNIISIKIDNLILDNSLSIDINKDIKIKLINIGYEETKIQFPKLFNKKTSNIGTQTTNFRNRANSI